MSFVFSDSKDSIRVVYPFHPYVRDVIISLPDPFAEFFHVSMVTGEGGTTNDLLGGKSLGHESG